MQKVIDGLLTNYLITNPNRPYTLVILHGWGQNASHWENVLRSLPSSFTGIALDLPAFGSTQAMTGNPGVPQYADFVNSFITKLKLKNIFLLGHSFGGQIAIDFSLRFPTKLLHLILFSPAYNRQTKPNKKSQLGRFLKPAIQKLPLFLRQSLFNHFASDNYLQSNATQRQVLNKILYQDYSARIKNIAVSTSIIWGDKDLTLPNDSKVLAENIPQSELFVIYNADHNPHLLLPTKFLSVLGTILQKNV